MAEEPTKSEIRVVPEGQPYGPGEIPAYRVEFEEAREAEDLFGIYNDLEFVVEVCRDLAAALRQEAEAAASSDPSPVGAAERAKRSLWIAALVTYSRCFIGGKRLWFDEKVFDGQPEHVLEWHRYFRNTRDKHVSHSVSPFEIFATGIRVLGHGGDNPHIERVVVLHATRGLERVDVVDKLGQLAAWAQNIAYERMNEAKKKVFDKAESLTPEELRRLRPMEEQPEQGFDTAGKRRR